MKHTKSREIEYYPEFKGLEKADIVVCAEGTGEDNNPIHLVYYVYHAETRELLGKIDTLNSKKD